MLFLLVTQYLMPYLKTRESGDSDAQEKYEKELEEASCISYVCRWAVGKLLGLPRAARGQLREVLWWAADDQGVFLGRLLAAFCSPIIGPIFGLICVTDPDGEFTNSFSGVNDVMKVSKQSYLA